MDVLVLLQTKNKCLERFLEVSLKFLSQLENEPSKELSPLQRKRDSILKAIDLFDRKLEESLGGLSPSDTNKILPEMKNYVVKRDELLKKIKFVDQKLLKLIEFETARIQKDLSIERKSQNQISKFKSQWIKESGSGVDQKL